MTNPSGAEAAPGTGSGAKNAKQAAEPSGNGNPVSADEGDTLRTIYNLWPFIWPADRPDLKVRVLIAIVALIIAKIVTVLSPYFFAWASDTLTGQTENVPPWLVAPVMLVLAYNAARILAVGFNQLRDALFARVGQYAVRQLANITFRHLHNLSLRFHLARRTGGLSRVIERGVKGIESIVRFTILNGFPTIFEFAIMAGVIWYQFRFLAMWSS